MDFEIETFFLEFQSLMVRGTNEFLKMSVFVESYLNCLLCDDLDNDMYQSITNIYRIGGVMVRVLASNAVGRGFEPRSDQSKDYKIGMCCFSAKHTALRGKEQ